MKSKEERKDVPGYEGLYVVSNLGFIYRVGSNKPLSSKHPSGYSRVSLSKNNIPTNYRVHRIVATVFIPNPDKLPEVNHKNRIREDNRVENLEWCTHRANVHHRKIMGGYMVITGENNFNAKLNNQDVMFIRNSNLSNVELAKMFNVCDSNIASVKLNKTWKHVNQQI